MMEARWIFSLCIISMCLFPMSAQTNLSGKRLHWNRERGYEPFRHATPSGVVIDNVASGPLADNYRLEQPASSFSLRFVASNSHNHPAKSYPFADTGGKRSKAKNPAWGFYVKGPGRDSLVFSIKTVEIQDAFSSEAAVIVSAHSFNTLEKVVTLKDGVDCHTGQNNWRLTVENGVATLLGGNHSLQTLLSFPFNLENISEFGFTANPGACITVGDITFSDNSPQMNLVGTSWSNPDHLRNYLAASKDTMEGYWTVFDRTLEESLLQLGGDYRFAIVKANDEYQLIYLGGARINAAEWLPGMVKAHIEEDFFPGIYNVTWIDSEGLPLSNGIKAQAGDGDTLTIQFPYHSSSLRLRKIPQ